MKVYVFLLAVLVCFMHVQWSNAEAKPFLDKLFSGYDSSYGYSNSYGGGYYPSRPRSYGKSYDGGERYKSICRVHAVDSLAFPGRIGNPVCR